MQNREVRQKYQRKSISIHTQNRGASVHGQLINTVTVQKLCSRRRKAPYHPFNYNVQCSMILIPIFAYIRDMSTYLGAIIMCYGILKFIGENPQGSNTKKGTPIIWLRPKGHICTKDKSG